MDERAVVGLPPLSRKKKQQSPAIGPIATGESATQLTQSSYRRHNGFAARISEQNNQQVSSQPSEASDAHFQSIEHGGARTNSATYIQQLLQAQRNRLQASPLGQQALENPQILTDVMNANPAARKIMEANPRLLQLMTSPDAMRSLLSGEVQQHQNVLGEGVHEHMATISDLNAYAQQLRQQTDLGSGTISAPDSQWHSPDQRQWHSKDDPSHQLPDSQHGRGNSALQERRRQQKQGLLPPLHLGPSNPRSPRRKLLPTSLSAGVATAASCALPPPDASVHLTQPPPPAIPAALEGQLIQQAGISQLPLSRDLHEGGAFGAVAAPTNGALAPMQQGGIYLKGEDMSQLLGGAPDHYNLRPQAADTLPGQVAAQAKVPHLDVAFPIAFCAVAASGCWSALLPFWALVVVLIVVFLLGLQATLAGSGIQPRLMPASRVMVSLVVTMELVGYTTLISILIPVMAPRRGLACAFAVAFSSASLFFHYRACTTQPGYLATDTFSEEAALPTPRFNMGTCATCRVVRPLRSKHCGYCGRCVEGADHHCPVLNTCVGRGNLRAFFAYIVTLLVAQVLFVQLAAAWCRVIIGDPQASVSDALRQAASSHPGVVLQAYVQIPSIAANGFLVGRALICIMANLTTNEMLRSSQLGYLVDDSGHFFNPFDQGPLQNCLQFWTSSGGSNWSGIFEDRLRAGKEAAVATLPLVSVTAVVRSSVRLCQQLKENSNVRQRRREDKILISRGGVDPQAAAASHAAADAAASSAIGCGHCRHGH